MKNPYYEIWSDAIQSGRKHNPDDKHWKINIFGMLTFIDSILLWTITIWTKYFNILEWPLIHIRFFPGTVLNHFFSYLISYAWPFVILNYFLIFYRDRYKKILDKYPSRKGKVVMAYVLSVLVVGLITALIYGIFLSDASD